MSKALSTRFNFSRASRLLLRGARYMVRDEAKTSNTIKALDDCKTPCRRIRGGISWGSFPLFN
jgi:hypothetical protein